MVTFGGISEIGLLGDTWEFDGRSWLQRITTKSPSARSLYAMATSPTGGIVMFGGDTVDGASSETWTWDGVSWHELGGVGPTARTHAGIAYDSLRHRVVLFGGLTDDDTELGDTWTWDGTTWTELSPASSPTPRSQSAMAYDVVRDRVVLIGGDDSSTNPEVWELDGTTWARGVDAPRSLLGPGVAYDTSQSLSAVVFTAGRDMIGYDRSDAFTYDLERRPCHDRERRTAPPTPRQEFAFAYDPSFGADILLMHGGIEYLFFNNSTSWYGDTDYYSAGSWGLVQLRTSPTPARAWPRWSTTAGGGARC